MVGEWLHRVGGKSLWNLKLCVLPFSISHLNSSQCGGLWGTPGLVHRDVHLPVLSHFFWLFLHITGSWARSAQSCMEWSVQCERTVQEPEGEHVGNTLISVLPSSEWHPHTCRYQWIQGRQIFCWQSRKLKHAEAAVCSCYMAINWKNPYSKQECVSRLSLHSVLQYKTSSY